MKRGLWVFMLYKEVCGFFFFPPYNPSVVRSSFTTPEALFLFILVSQSSWVFIAAKCLLTTNCCFIYRLSSLANILFFPIIPRLSWLVKGQRYNMYPINQWLLCVFWLDSSCDVCLGRCARSRRSPRLANDSVRTPRSIHRTLATRWSPQSLMALWW